MSEIDETEAAEVAEIPNETLDSTITATQAADVSENESESSVTSIESSEAGIRSCDHAFSDADLVLVSEETLVRFLQETQASDRRRETILARRIVLLRIESHITRLREFAEERALLDTVGLELAQWERESEARDRPPPQ